MSPPSVTISAPTLPPTIAFTASRTVAAPSIRRTSCPFAPRMSETVPIAVCVQPRSSTTATLSATPRSGCEDAAVEATGTDAPPERRLSLLLLVVAAHQRMGQLVERELAADGVAASDYALLSLVGGRRHRAADRGGRGARDAPHDRIGCRQATRRPGACRARAESGRRALGARRPDPGGRRRVASWLARTPSDRRAAERGARRAGRGPARARAARG